VAAEVEDLRRQLQEERRSKYQLCKDFAAELTGLQEQIKHLQKENARLKEHNQRDDGARSTDVDTDSGPLSSACDISVVSSGSNATVESLVRSFPRLE